MQVIKTWSENTNNDWGFGGYNCDFTEYDNGVIKRIGRYSHRHTGTSSANCVMVRVSKYFYLPIKSSAKSTRYVSTLKGVECISVFNYGTHYQAIAKDINELECYGWDYNLLKKIQISKTI